MKKIRSYLLFGTLFCLIACQKDPRGQLEIPAPNSLGIIGGLTAAANEFPFMVNIWQNSPRENYVAHLCGGSLIHKKWVLTAAHCVLEDASENTQRTIKVTELTLYVGSQHISGTGGRPLKVKRILPHPDFSWPHHDLALLELEKEVTDIQPVTLNHQDWEDSQLPKVATVIGWGLTDDEGNIDAEYLQKLDLPLISRNSCSQDEFPRKRGWTIGKDTLCAETNLNQRASCPGDSGGPLVMATGTGYTQIGVVSWGSACSGKAHKFRSNVEGHASVANALEWIQSTIR